MGAIDLAHGARADGGQNLVAAKARAGVASDVANRPDSSVNAPSASGLD